MPENHQKCFKTMMAEKRADQGPGFLVLETVGSSRLSMDSEHSLVKAPLAVPVSSEIWFLSDKDRYAT